MAQVGYFCHMRHLTDLAYIVMVAFAAAGAAEIVGLRLHSSARRMLRWRSLLDDLEPDGLSFVPSLDTPVIGDALDQSQPAVSLQQKGSLDEAPRVQRRGR